MAAPIELVLLQEWWMDREADNFPLVKRMAEDETVGGKYDEGDWGFMDYKWGGAEICERMARMKAGIEDVEKKALYAQRMGCTGIDWVRSSSESLQPNFEEWEETGDPFIDVLVSGWQNMRFGEQLKPLLAPLCESTGPIVKDMDGGGVGRIKVRLFMPNRWHSGRWQRGR